MPSIDENKYRVKLDEILAAYSVNLAIDTKRLADETLRNIQNGMPVSKAIDKALKDTGFFVANNAATIDAVYMAACAGYGIFPTIVANPLKLKTKLLSESWTGDKVTLSKRLHGVNKQMRTDIIDTIHSSMRKTDTCIEMAKKLYDGYGFPTVINQAALPKYLDDLKKAVKNVTQGDTESYSEFSKALKQAELQISKLARSNAPTLALKDGYKVIADASKDGYKVIADASKALGDGTITDALKRKLKRQGLTSIADLNQAIFDINNKALDKAVHVALEERSRYHAERIARTESSRAWFDGFIAENHDNPDIVAYKWVLSSRHKHLPFDICDVYANADFGLGVGIFPKDKVPNIPVHPHCMCSLVKVYDGELPNGKKFDPGKASKYINDLPVDKKKALLGVEGAKNYKGKDWEWSARNHNGFGKPESRLSADDFNLQLHSERNIRVKMQKQWEHIEGTKQYYQRLKLHPNDPPPSLMTYPDIQELVNGYHGKGTMKINKDGSETEVVATDKIIGKYWNKQKQEYIDTKAMKIVYSSKGVHVYPIWDGTKEV